MGLLLAAASFLTAIGLHAVLVRVRPGNRVIQFAVVGAVVGAVLIAILCLRPHTTLERGAAIAGYAFACELYIFLFTFVTSSVSVSLLLGRTAQVSLEPREMVRRRLGVMAETGLLKAAGEGYVLTGKARRMVSIYSLLRRFFGHDTAGASGGSGPVRVAALVAALLCIALFATAALERFECLALANESIAYRWGNSSRIISGDVPTILPQGFTILAFQEYLVAAMEHFQPLSSASLRPALQIFSWATFGFFAAVFLGLLMATVRDRRNGAFEAGWITLPWIAGVYATGSAGWYYALLPDYYHLNALLACAMVLLLVPVVSRIVQPDAPAAGAARLALLGLVLGCGIANKITWAVPAVAAAGLVFLAARSWRRALLDPLLVASTAAASVLGVLLLYYRFDGTAVVTGYREWLAFMQNQQGSLVLWSDEFRARLRDYNYDVLYPLAALTLLPGFVVAKTARARLALLGVAAAFAALCWMVTRRPAGTTLWDVNLLTLALAGLGALLTPGRSIRRVLAAVWLVALVALAWRNPPVSTLHTIRASQRACDNRFAVFDELTRFAASRPQLVMFVNNEYHHEGVHELLLKAASDFPTWNIGRGKAWLNRLFPDMVFAHEYSPPIVLPEELGNQCIVWFDRPDLPLLTSRYAELAAFAADPRNEVISLPIYLSGLQEPPVVQVWVHAVRRREDAPFVSRFDQSTAPAYLRSGPSAPPTPVPALAPVARRLQPGVIELTWPGDAAGGDCEVEMAAGDAPFAAIGRGSAGAGRYVVGDISPTSVYRFRLRRWLNGYASEWTETGPVTPLAP